MSNIEWKSAESIDGVRDELRRALLSVGLFQLAAGKFTGMSAADKDFVQQKMCFLVEFGHRAGLLSTEEANDWMAGIWERAPLGIVSNKWLSDDEEVVAGAKELLAREAQ